MIRWRSRFSAKKAITINAQNGFERSIIARAWASAVDAMTAWGVGEGGGDGASWKFNDQ